MTLNERILAFSALEKKISSLDQEVLLPLMDKVRQHNPWFTSDNILLSLTGIRKLLVSGKLKQWTSTYKISDEFTSKVIALVLAGNIPLAGFHDVLCVLLSGHRAMIKMSSKDTVLLPAMITWLIETEPRFKDRIQYAETLKSFDAIIATGSDNSARYFEYYFGKYPHIIRKNRSSCAILTGHESAEELTLLGHDVFAYFGLGCRNVSKIFIPEGYDLSVLIEAWQPYAEIRHHNKYGNNYDYQKAILIMNKQPFMDAGFVLLTESGKVVSPISVVYYETYTDIGNVKSITREAADKIQCIVGNTAPATVSFGQAQYPEVWDYADRVDTLAFLCRLN